MMQLYRYTRCRIILLYKEFLFPASTGSNGQPIRWYSLTMGWRELLFSLSTPSTNPELTFDTPVYKSYPCGGTGGSRFLKLPPPHWHWNSDCYLPVGSSGGSFYEFPVDRFLHLLKEVRGCLFALSFHFSFVRTKEKQKQKEKAPAPVPKLKFSRFP